MVCKAHSNVSWKNDKSKNWAEKEIDEPKFLSKKVLRYPQTLIISLLNESKYLFENAIFEIVSHALNVHRGDIKSDVKIKKLVKESKKDFKIDVRELYYTKVKSIYGEIIKYATLAQSKLTLRESQNNHITAIKIANRKMVEIVRDTRELSRNTKFYSSSENVYIKKEYDKFRKKIVKVLRTIYLFRTVDEKEIYYQKLLVLKNKAKEATEQSNKSIDKLIRENLITVDMASSLVNDNDNVNNMIKKLIQVAELLYGETDILLEGDK